VVEGEGVGHAGFVDDHQGVGSDVVGEGFVVVDGPDEFGEVVRGDGAAVAGGGEVVAELFGGGGGGCQAEDGAAAGGPGGGQGAHSGGLAGAGGGDGELEPAA